MADFVYDVITIDDSKVDRAPIPVGEDTNKWLDASEWNAAVRGMYDIKDAIINNRFLGLQRLNAQPNVPTGGAPDFLWMTNAGAPTFHIGGVNYNFMLTSGLTVNRMVVATGADSVGDSSFISTGDTLDLAVPGVFSLGPANTAQMFFGGDQPVTSGTGASVPTFVWTNAGNHVLEMWMGTFDTSNGTTGVEFDAVSPLDGTTYLGGLKFTDKTTSMWAPSPGYLSQETFLTLPGASNPGVQNLLWAGRNNNGSNASLWGRWWATAHAIEFDSYDPSANVFDPYASNTTHGGIYFGNDPAGDETDMWGPVVGGNQSGIGFKSDGTAYISTGPVASQKLVTFTYPGGISMPDRLDITNTVAGGPPTFTTKSTGQKITLYPALSPTAADFAIGVDNSGSGFLWMGTPTTQGFQWYAGTHEAMRLEGNGVLDTICIAAAPDAQSILNIGVNPGGTGSVKHAFETWVATPGPSAGNALLAFSITDGVTPLGNLGFTSLGAQLVAADGTTMVMAKNDGTINLDTSVTLSVSSAVTHEYLNNGKLWGKWTAVADAIEFDMYNPSDGTTVGGGLYFGIATSVAATTEIFGPSDGSHLADLALRPDGTATIFVGPNDYSIRVDFTAPGSIHVPAGQGLDTGSAGVLNIGGVATTVNLIAAASADAVFLQTFAVKNGTQDTIEGSSGWRSTPDPGSGWLEATEMDFLGPHGTYLGGFDYQDKATLYGDSTACFFLFLGSGSRCAGIIGEADIGLGGGKMHAFFDPTFYADFATVGVPTQDNVLTLTARYWPFGGGGPSTDYPVGLAAVVTSVGEGGPHAKLSIRFEGTEKLSVNYAGDIVMDAASSGIQFPDGNFQGFAVTDATVLPYIPTTPANWSGAAPTNVGVALDRLAAACVAAGHTP